MHITGLMRITVDLPDDLVQRAKIAAVRCGLTLRDLVAGALWKLLADQGPRKRKRMDPASIKLPPEQTIPIRFNAEIAQLFEQKDAVDLNDVYRERQRPASAPGRGVWHWMTTR